MRRRAGWFSPGLTMLVRASACALGAAGLLTACGGPASSSRGSSAQSQQSTGLTETAALIGTEPWSFGTADGVLLRTPHYRVFTTEPNGTVRRRLPSFVERALAHYTGSFDGLPEPASPMETFVMANRPQWVRLTGTLYGSQAQPVLAIRRGGFAINGRALLWDVGVHDTFSLIAHEGWHQYTQTAFRDRLPPWAEEGIATYMEGFRWTGPGLDRPDFLPWANRERYDQLRRVSLDQDLLPLAMLVSVSPGELLDDVRDAALVYYAQVWALVHFLEEGEGGKYREGFRAMVRDAARGRIAIETRARLIERGGANPDLRRYGGMVFGAYIGNDLPTIESEFRAFVETVAGSGSAGAVFEGRSPVNQ